MVDLLKDNKYEYKRIETIVKNIAAHQEQISSFYAGTCL